MKKRLAFILILLIVPFFIIGCSDKNVAPEVPQRQAIEGPAIMWEVTSNDSGAKLYLLGSIHIAKKDMYPLNKTITDAFNESKSLAVEIDIVAFEKDTAAVRKMANAMIYRDGTTIEDHISQNAFALLKNKVENGGIKGIPKGYEYYYKPMMIYSVLSDERYESYGYKSKYGIDNYFLKEAKKKNMEIIELESSEFQYNLLLNFSEQIQSAMLTSVLLPSFSESETLSQLFESWEKGDEGAFEELLMKADEQDKNSLGPDGEKYYLEYKKQMIDDRNVAMTEKAVELLEGNQTYFYVVGAAHMVGENGIVKALIDRGYKVEKK